MTQRRTPANVGTTNVEFDKCQNNKHQKSITQNDKLISDKRQKRQTSEATNIETIFP